MLFLPFPLLIEAMVDSLLLAAARVATFEETRLLTNASGFFFARDARLFFVTSRHVMHDEPSGHAPDRIEIELHVDAGNLARSTGYSIPLYRDGTALWRQGIDGGGARRNRARRGGPPDASLS